MFRLRLSSLLNKPNCQGPDIRPWHPWLFFGQMKNKFRLTEIWTFCFPDLIDFHGREFEWLSWKSHDDPLSRMRKMVPTIPSERSAVKNKFCNHFRGRILEPLTFYALVQTLTSHVRLWNRMLIQKESVLRETRFFPEISSLSGKTS